LLEGDILSLVDLALLPLSSHEELVCDEKARLLGIGVPHGEIDSGEYVLREHLYRYSRTKAHAPAGVKTNIFLSDVIKTCSKDTHSLGGLTAFAPFFSSLYNDHACGVVIHAHALSALTRDAFEIGARAAHDPEGVKTLNTILKSSGNNGTRIGAMFCEMQALIGRGAGKVDLAHEASYRCDVKAAAESVVACDDALRRAIRWVLSVELPNKGLVFDDVDDFWTKRWSWCVNGAHSPQYGREYPEWAVDYHGMRLHRRAAVELLDKNPLLGWNGTSIFTGSEKLEHGKTRAIFAGDTVTYVCFGHLLQPVERAWQGTRVLLDPGQSGTVGMVRRLQRLKGKGSINVMLDYDDFNSQHSTESMQCVFEELIAHVGYPAALGARLVESFNRSRVFVGGKDCGYARGTLMSGHRATTFINSVLNAAYLHREIPGFEAVTSVHVGDDVYIRAASGEHASDIVDRVVTSPLRVNPQKQSVGHVTAEFLRIAVSEGAARGYLARSIASAVSGNWANEAALSPPEVVTSVRNHVWTLAMRSGTNTFSDFFIPHLVKRTGLSNRECAKLLDLGTSVGGSPAWGRRDYVETVAVDTISPLEIDGTDAMPARATTAYLANHVPPIERDFLRSTGLSVYSAMLESSWKKTTDSTTDSSRPLAVVLTNGARVRASRPAVVSDLIATRPSAGVLSSSPVMQLVKSQLTTANLRYLIHANGREVVGDVYHCAWGDEPHTVIVDGYLPAADASHLSGRTQATVLYSDFPIMF
jgi:hypothetical protein